MEKLNLVELLKDCPKGMELDCTMFDDVKFISVEEYDKPICIRTGDIYRYLTKFGTWTFDENAKCVIFPKGKTTWEEFQIPFKDGDVVVCEENKKITQMFILKSQINNMRGYFYTGYDFKHNDFFEEGNWYFDRLATEEEKQKLFDVIKANGYKWNAETKTLEKLIKPKFKVGDKIEKCRYSFTITEVKEDYYLTKCGNKIPIENQDDFNLIFDKFNINTLKPFESKVLVRDVDYNEWEGAIFGRYDGKTFFTIGGLDWEHCIPYEGNEHLLGTTDDCSSYYKTWE